MSQGAIAKADNLFDFFHASVGDAASRTRSDMSEEGLLYLAQLLVERGRSQPEREAPDTLAELYAAAWRGPPAERLWSWRELADRALYVTGFFRKSLTRRAVGPRYYMEMGAAAYRRLARTLGTPRGGGRGLDEIWGELGERFEDASDLLSEVHDDLEAAEVHSDSDVLRLYESWLTTGSARLYARLLELGVLAGRPPGEEPR